MSRRALVIGGTGPSGPHVVNGLVDRGFETAILHSGAHEPPERDASGSGWGCWPLSSAWKRDAMSRNIGSSLSSSSLTALGSCSGVRPSPRLGVSSGSPATSPSPSAGAAASCG